MSTEARPCVLFQGFLGLALQGLLFVSVLCSLAYKKTYDDRTWTVFSLDLSKQLISSGWVHVFNLLAAMEMNALRQDGKMRDDGAGILAVSLDECDLYWLNLMIDTTLGVGVDYIFLECLILCQNRVFLLSDVREERRSNYWNVDGEFAWNVYFLQLFTWLLAVTLMKIFVVAFITWQLEFLGEMTRFALSLFDDKPQAKLVFIMILTPMVMNSFQAWITDAFLKSESRHISNTEAGVCE